VNPFHFLKKHQNRCTLVWGRGVPISDEGTDIVVLCGLSFRDLKSK
jgi:hypothetical protein